jgi:fused signal recognition particle receptor
MNGVSFFDRLKKGLSKTREGLASRLEGILQLRKWDEEALAGVEESLLAADVGFKATQRLLDAVRQRSPGWNGGTVEDLFRCLKDEMLAMLAAPGPAAPAAPEQTPRVILFLGVNGAGKTTTIGKMAARERVAGKKVLLVAADTFRAAAVEQLEAWGQRAGAEIVKHGAGADPSAVVFDGIQVAKKRRLDVVLVDTAGRLHNKVHLVEELKKVKRVAAREQAGAPHESLLVLDAATGQNGFQQARVFKESLEVTGIVLTKLDGTAKGGVILSIHEELGIPVRYIGVGEETEDLQPFDPGLFVEALFQRG